MKKGAIRQQALLFAETLGLDQGHFVQFDAAQLTLDQIPVRACCQCCDEPVLFGFAPPAVAEELARLFPKFPRASLEERVLQ